jgi:hypothetical protein
MELIYFVLACWGLTQALLYGSIFDRIRPSREWLGGFGKLSIVRCVWDFMLVGFCLS